MMIESEKLLISYWAPTALCFLLSCKTQPGSNRQYDDNNPNKVYHLRLSPTEGSQYLYSVTRSTEFEMNVDGKKIDNKNRSQMEIAYTIGRDSLGDIVLSTVYNKIHLYTKNGGTEQEEDADKAGESTDPVEKMLGILKGAKLRAVVSSTGEVRSIKGDEEIKNKLMGEFSPGDTYGKTIASKQWDQQVKQGLLRNNMEQLFKIFPEDGGEKGEVKGRLGRCEGTISGLPIVLERKVYTNKTLGLALPL